MTDRWDRRPKHQANRMCLHPRDLEKISGREFKLPHVLLPSSLLKNQLLLLAVRALYRWVG